ncbi:MAG: tetratricopeptide repeat protein [candidate division NC10 bacterium]|nr:tetratricopeptide repeat protein [candidate division NC10 bacterium]
MTPWPRPTGSGGGRRIPLALGVTLRLLGLLFFFSCVPILGALLFAEPAAAAPLASEEVLDAARAFARVFDAVPALSARARGEAASVPAEALPGAQQILRALEREEGTNPFLWAAWGIVAGAGQDAAGAARAYRRASELAGNGLATRWSLLKLFQALGREEEARQEWQQLRRLRLRLGLDRVTFIAEELTLAARAFAAAGQGEAAEQTVALAAEFDPVSADVHLARAGLLLRRGRVLNLGFLRAVGGAARGFYADLPVRYAVGVNLLAALLTALPLALFLMAVVLAVRDFPLFHHDVVEATRFRLSAEAQRTAALLLLGLPFLLGLGALWFSCVALVLVGAYLKVKERLIASVALLLTALIPDGATGLALLYGASTSPRVAALMEVERGGRGSGLLETVTRWTAEEPKEVLPLLAQGLIHRRRGELAEARTAYQRALALVPDLPGTHVNLGNVAFLQGEPERARQAYERALALNPEDPLALFNLSQYQTERLQLEQAQTSYEAAVGRLPALAGRLALATAGGAERVLVDAPIPVEGIWRVATAGSADTPVLAGALWGGRLPYVPLASAPWVLGGAAVLIWVVAFLKAARGHALSCEKCGRPFCPKCQRFFREGRLCARCAAAFKREGVGETTKTLRVREHEAYRARARRSALAFSVVFPGAGHLYVGSALAGFLLLLVALWAALQGLLLPWAIPVLHLPQPAEGLFAAFGGALFLACYLWSVRARKKVGA